MPQLTAHFRFDKLVSAAGHRILIRRPTMLNCHVPRISNGNSNANANENVQLSCSKLIIHYASYCQTSANPLPLAIIHAHAHAHAHLPAGHLATPAAHSLSIIYLPPEFLRAISSALEVLR